MSLNPPSFESHIPQHLTKDCTPQDKWLIENMSKMLQSNSWLINNAKDQSEVIGRIDVQVAATNGRLLKAEGSIDDLKHKVKKTAEDDKVIHFVLKMMKTKTFWACTAFFFLCFLPWLYSFHFTVKDVATWIFYS